LGVFFLEGGDRTRAFSVFGKIFCVSTGAGKKRKKRGAGSGHYADQ